MRPVLIGRHALALDCAFYFNGGSGHPQPLGVWQIRALGSARCKMSGLYILTMQILYAGSQVAVDLVYCQAFGASDLPQCFCWVGVQGRRSRPCTPTWGGSEGPGYPLGAPSEPPQQNQCG